VTRTGSVRSIGSSVLYLVGSTVKAQPVFLQAGNERLGDLLAIGIDAPEGNGAARRPITYWYHVPKGLLTRQFALWQRPFAKEQGDQEPGQERMDLRLMNGIGVRDQVITELAPRVHFSIKTYSEQRKEAQGDQNAKNEAIKRFHAENPLADPLYLIEPVSKDMPEC
jgi:hypothetical protein